MWISGGFYLSKITTCLPRVAVPLEDKDALLRQGQYQGQRLLHNAPDGAHPCVLVEIALVSQSVSQVSMIRHVHVCRVYT